MGLLLHGHLLSFLPHQYQDSTRWVGAGGPNLEVYVRVLHQRGDEGSHRVDLLDDGGEPIAVVSGFLLFLAARDCSPNTLVSYAYDLRHLWRFFDRDGLAWEEFAPRHSIALLEYLRSVPSRRPRQRMALTVAVFDEDGPATKLAATTVNRILAAVSSFMSTSSWRACSIG